MTETQPQILGGEGTETVATFLSSFQAAKKLNTSLDNIRQMVCRNQMPRRHWMGRLVFTQQDIDKILQKRWNKEKSRQFQPFDPEWTPP